MRRRQFVPSIRAPWTPLPEVAYVGPTPPPELRRPRKLPESTPASLGAAGRGDATDSASGGRRGHRTTSSSDPPTRREAPGADASKARFQCARWGATAALHLPIWPMRSERRPRYPPARTMSICRVPDELEVEESAEASSSWPISAPTPPPTPRSAVRDARPRRRRRFQAASSRRRGPRRRRAPSRSRPPPPPVEEAAHGPLSAGPSHPARRRLPRPRRPKRSLKPWFGGGLRRRTICAPSRSCGPIRRCARWSSSRTRLTTAPGFLEILDVGCGHGRHAIELVQRGFNVTGLDLSRRC